MTHFPPSKQTKLLLHKECMGGRERETERERDCRVVNSSGHGEEKRGGESHSNGTGRTSRFQADMNAKERIYNLTLSYIHLTSGHQVHTYIKIESSNYLCVSGDGRLHPPIKHSTTQTWVWGPPKHTDGNVRYPWRGAKKFPSRRRISLTSLWFHSLKSMLMKDGKNYKSVNTSRQLPNTVKTYEKPCSTFVWRLKTNTQTSCSRTHKALQVFLLSF